MQPDNPELDEVLLFVTEREINRRLNGRMGAQTLVDHMILPLPFEFAQRALHLIADKRQLGGGARVVKTHAYVDCDACGETNYVGATPLPAGALRTCEFCGEEIEVDDCLAWFQVVVSDPTKALYDLRNKATTLQRHLAGHGLGELATVAESLADELHAQAQEVSHG